MIKNISLVIGGILLSFVLVVAGGWIILQFTPMKAALIENAAAWYEHGDPFVVMGVTLSIIEFVMCPVIAIAVGVYVGFLARRLAWQLSAISSIPLITLFLTASTWRWGSIALAGLYLLIASAIAFVVARWRSRRRASIIR